MMTALFLLLALAQAKVTDNSLTEVSVTSSLDGRKQPVRLWAPESAKQSPTPVLVYLHSWSAGYRQKNTAWLRQAAGRGWIIVHPDFRGANVGPTACGSKFARQDVIDALDYVLENYDADRSRIYLAGSSGGGHMTLLMAGYHPDRFSAASAWVGITDLAEWYRFHTRTGKPHRYAKNVAACCGGPPGASEEVDRQYRERSPIFHLHRIGDLPVDIAAGVHDGHTGSVPIRHSLNAFNVIAKSRDLPGVPQKVIDHLSNQRSYPVAPWPRVDPTYGRRIHLRQSAGNSRITIFEGGHEGLAPAGCSWLAQQVRGTTR